jgi:hypothetical protein
VIGSPVGDGGRESQAVGRTVRSVWWSQGSSLLHPAKPRGLDGDLLHFVETRVGTARRVVFERFFAKAPRGEAWKARRRSSRRGGRRSACSCALLIKFFRGQSQAWRPSCARSSFCLPALSWSRSLSDRCWRAFRLCKSLSTIARLVFGHRRVDGRSEGRDRAAGVLRDRAHSDGSAEGPDGSRRAAGCPYLQRRSAFDCSVVACARRRGA